MIQRYLNGKVELKQYKIPKVLMPINAVKTGALNEHRAKKILEKIY